MHSYTNSFIAATKAIKYVLPSKCIMIIVKCLIMPWKTFHGTITDNLFHALCVIAIAYIAIVPPGII